MIKRRSLGAVSVLLLLLLFSGIWFSCIKQTGKTKAPDIVHGVSESTIITTLSSAQAEETEEDPTSVTFFASQIDEYIDIPKGFLDWHLLGKTKEITRAGKTQDGYDFQYFEPEFPAKLKELDGKNVTVKGYMFPLDQTEDQKLFLIGPFPLSCPFQYHVGPSLVIEVHATGAGIPFNYDPVTITGTLELVEKDMENSTFYRLRNARSR